MGTWPHRIGNLVGTDPGETALLLLLWLNCHKNEAKFKAGRESPQGPDSVLLSDLCNCEKINFSCLHNTALISLAA